MYEIGREEVDLNKCAKIDALRLSDEEWANVENFTDLLRVSLTAYHPHITNFELACRQISAGFPI